MKFSANHFTELKQILDTKLKHKEFKIEYISALEVKTIIEKLDINKATGLDEIGPKVIKLCGDYITPIIANILNQSINMRPLS